MQKEWVYHNQETGVYFILEYSPQPKDEHETIIPPEYNDIGLSFNINYNRPKFFADESMPVVASMCNDLDLLVIDPQDHEIGGDSSPKYANAKDLIESWTNSNKMALSIYKQQGALPPYLPRKEAESWWNYHYHRKIIQSDIGESIFVPNIFLLHKPEDKRVITTITWTDSIPIIFPDCDKVLIIHMETKGFLRKKNETVVKGIIDSEIIREKFKDFIKVTDTVIGPMQVINPSEEKSIRNLFFQLTGNLEEFDYEGIGPDSIIDEKI